MQGAPGPVGRAVAALDGTEDKAICALEAFVWGLFAGDIGQAKLVQGQR